MTQDNIAFAVISCGPYARTYKAETFIESLVKNGEWSGRIFLITDSPGCFDIDEIRKVSGSERIFLISVPAFSNGFDSFLKFYWRKSGPIKWPCPKFVTSHTGARSKSLKAELFDLIADQDVEVVVFSDCDSIVTRSDEMKALFDLAEDWSKGDGIKFRLGTEDPDSPGTYTRRSRVHGGFFIAHRTYSAKALNHWKKIMSDPVNWIKSGHDRDKFHSAFCEAELENPRHNYMFVYSIANELNLEGFSALDRKFMIEHITFGRLNAHGSRAIEAYVKSFDLRAFPEGTYFGGRLPRWLKVAFYFGYMPYLGNYKIENLAKKLGVRR